MSNRLAETLSPYLQQHKDNPIHWYPWCEAAFIAAKLQDKPIFLSIGYSACHWCHVMAHESFEDEEIAAFLNRYFICIKVDREEHPEIDKIYMDAVMRMQGHGGWPLSVFLTPDAKPFFGGTYFPNKPRYGQVSFGQLIDSVLYAWQHQRQDIEGAGNEMAEAISRLLPAQNAENVMFQNLMHYKDGIKTNFDLSEGGFVGQPKFPQVPLWQWLTILGQYSKDTNCLEHCYFTALKLCMGGIYDHVGGGWMRYSTDEKWFAPHFEKMLYDNALLIEWMAELHAYKPNPIFKDRISKTIQWLNNEMLLSQGVFASSLDADSEGEEGKYYVWTTEELKKALGDGHLEFARCFGVTEEGNWENTNILHRNHAMGFGPETSESAEALSLLSKIRSQRIPPARDDKVNTEWNALLIAALAQAGVYFDSAAWLKMAENTFKSLQNLMLQNGEWAHCYRDGKYSDRLLCEDYAAVIHAAITLACATGQESYLELAEEYTQFTLKFFYNSENHLFHQRPKLDTDLIYNPQVYQDNATPSSNGLMARNLAILYLLRGNAEYQQKIYDMTTTLNHALKSSHAHYFSSLCQAIAWVEKGCILKCGLNKIAPDIKKLVLERKPFLMKIFEDGKELPTLCDALSCQEVDLREFLLNAFT